MFLHRLICLPLISRVPSRTPTLALNQGKREKIKGKIGGKLWGIAHIHSDLTRSKKTKVAPKFFIIPKNRKLK
jgi:hypothetical protein